MGTTNGQKTAEQHAADRKAVPLSDTYTHKVRNRGAKIAGKAIFKVTMARKG